MYLTKLRYFIKRTWGHWGTMLAETFLVTIFELVVVSIAQENQVKQFIQRLGQILNLGGE